MKEEKQVFEERDKRINSNPFKRSFTEALREVEARIEWECLSYERKARGRELAMIITEVERLPPNSLIRVDGEDHEAYEVAEIYQMLTHDHIESVLDNLDETRYRVKAMKTYLRTALYNAVFTVENSVVNEVNSSR